MVADKNGKKNANSVNDALAGFVNAYVQGEQPDIDEFVEKYPQHREQIRRRVESLREIDALFDSIVQADDNDFADAVGEPALVGRTIGNFEITQMVGRGGMGVVYLAHDNKLKRSVAVKSIPVTTDHTAQMRFRREAELLASLNHPNIAVVHEIVEEEKSGYLILEYVPGETLS
jgi:serine/threonine protein kinase